MSSPPWETEVEFIAVKAQGPGGQNVNKVANAVHLRFDVTASSLSSEVKARLLSVNAEVNLTQFAELSPK